MPTQAKSPSATARRAEILESLLTQHRRALLRQAIRHAPRYCDAEDVIQEACAQFMHAYNGPPGLRAKRWMLLVVKRCAWRFAERERPHRACAELNCTDASPEGESAQVAAADGTFDPHRTVEHTERFAGTLSALARLKADERTALMLFGLGYSYREICEKQGWTYTKVNRCLAEGRAALRAADEGGDG